MFSLGGACNLTNICVQVGWQQAFVDMPNNTSTSCGMGATGDICSAARHSMGIGWCPVGHWIPELHELPGLKQDGAFQSLPRKSWHGGGCWLHPCTVVPTEDVYGWNNYVLVHQLQREDHPSALGSDSLHTRCVMRTVSNAVKIQCKLHVMSPGS